MVKGNPKSSASSATRKKHAKKHGPSEDPAQQPSAGGKMKGGSGGGGKGGKKNKEPRVKMYIPPVKPSPVQPDPLETTGLGHILPADLLVVLRTLSKKAQVTKVRALEELQMRWVEKCLKIKKEGGEDEEGLVFTLVKMLPVWLHHLPALFVNPSRRVRLLASSLHSSFLQIEEVHDQILFVLRETAPSWQVESVLGTWCLTAHDVDRSVSTVASKSWKEIVVISSASTETEDTSESSTSSPKHILLDDNTRASLTSFIQQTALDPGGVYLYLNPAPPPPLLTPVHPFQAKKGGSKGSQSHISTPRRDDGGDQTPRSKVDEQEESETDKRARLRIAALGASKWLLESISTLSEDLISFYSNSALWTSLSSRESSPWVGVESFGFAQPNVRKAAWTLLQLLLTLHKDSIAAPLPVLAIAVLRSAWVELDTLVQGVMWQPLLIFLRQYPQSWTVEFSESQDTEAEDVETQDAEGGSVDDSAQSAGKDPLYKVEKSSEAYQEFLQFLQSGCSGSPVQGYPTVVIILSTIPPSILLTPSSEVEADGLSLSSSSPPPPLSQFFASFWSALDSRALSSLHRAAASAAFLSSLLECLIFVIKRIRKSDETSQSTLNPKLVENLVTEQLSRVWDQLSAEGLKVEERAAARLLGQTLESLFEFSSPIFDVAWNVLSRKIKAASASGNEKDARLVSAVLKVFIDRFKVKTEGALKERAESLLRDVLREGVDRCENAVKGAGEEVGKENFVLLVDLLEQFREGLFFDQVSASKLDELLSSSASQFLSLSPSLLLSYLVHRKVETKSLAVWHSLLSSIASYGSPDPKAIGSLLDAAQRGVLPKYLKPLDGELDVLVGNLLQKALAGPPNSDEALLMKRILSSSDYLVSQPGFISFLETIVRAFAHNVQMVTEGKEVDTSVFDVAVYFIQAVSSTILRDQSLTRSLMPATFIFSYLQPVCAANASPDTEAEPTQSQVSGKGLWEEWLKVASEEEKEDIVRVVKDKLKNLMEDSTSHPLPRDVLQTLSQQPPGVRVNLLQDVFPSAAQLDSILDGLSSDPGDPSIAVLDNLLPTTTSSGLKNKTMTASVADRRGFTPYARIVDGLSYAFVEDRQLAKRNLWALRHLLSLAVYAQDLTNVTSSYQYGVPLFDGKVSQSGLDDVVGRVRQVSVYLFNSFGSDDGAWKRTVVERAMAEGTSGVGKGDGGLSDKQRFLLDVIGHARKEDGVRDARVLKVVLEAVLADGVDVAEADLWVQLARKIEKTAPQTSMVIISAVTSTAVESPKLDRYRNELAASLLGIKPARANTEGLLALRRLVACAPNLEGDVAFLPTPRAVNVMKALQAWALEGDDEDDDDLDEEVESAMVPIFMNLAPVLQNVPGSHWPFVFDVLEAVLERASGSGSGSEEDDDGHSEAEEEETEDVRRDEKEMERRAVDYRKKLGVRKRKEGPVLVALARALRLVVLLEDLAARNKSLREEWQERRMGVFTTIRDLKVIGKDAVHDSSIPLTKCRELALSILQHLPESLIDENTLPKMVHLIEDAVPNVQKLAYQLLKSAAKKRTEHFVIEAGVETETVVQSALPLELLEIVQREIEGEEEYQNVFGYLLAWMLVFDSFQDASFKVRSGYIEQMRNMNVVVGHFIPCFLSLLQLDRGGLPKAFKLDVWSVDVFYVNLYQPGNPHTIPVFSAHVYYRALLTIPSLIHSWVLDCKDRQLTNAVMVYTSNYFSPVLIRAELEHVKSHAASDGLADDSLSVKVASSMGAATGGGGGAGGGGSGPNAAATTNEVVASYAVDEHQLEIRIRIPNDWPLHKVEVRDVKRVGVDENRWRAWVLGVQQTIWAHNGRIVDGLGLFKKNVTLHFEGQVECAICYSIISVLDGTLPKKPCKTCKNRFHAGCLYKWFNSSHSSSCPLCRSDII